MQARKVDATVASVKLEPPIKRDAKKVVYNAYNYFKKQKIDKNTRDANICKLVAVATGVKENTVRLIISEGNTSMKNTGEATFCDTQSQTRKKEKLHVYDYDLGAIRKTIYRMYIEQKVLPSRRTLAATFVNDRRVPVNLLFKIGYCYEKCDENRSILVEKTDMIEKRFDYLRTMHKCRSENKNNIFFVGVTTLESITYGDTGQGFGLNVMVAGTQNGLIVDSVEIYSSQRDIITTRFHQWVEHKLKNNLPPNSVVIMDSESYQCLQIKNMPTIESLKAEMQEWLCQRHIHFAPDMSKVELLKIINLIPQQKEYKVHEILRGHIVLHVPPFHTDLNPMMLVLKDIKESFYRQCILTLEEKASTLKILFSEYSVEKVKKYNDLVCGNEKEYWMYDMKMDSVLDEFILGLRSGAYDKDCDSENDANDDSEISDEDNSE